MYRHSWTDNKCSVCGCIRIWGKPMEYIKKGKKSSHNQIKSLFQPSNIVPDKGAREDLKNHLQDFSSNNVMFNTQVHQ